MKVITVGQEVGDILNGSLKCGKCNKIMTMEYGTYPYHKIPCNAICLECKFEITIGEVRIND